MWIETEQGRQFVRQMVQPVITGVVPEELPFFEELMESYFADPTPPDLTILANNDPLGHGLSDILLALTPAATAVIVYCLTFLSQQRLPGPASIDTQQQKAAYRMQFNYADGLQQLLNQIPAHHRRYSELLVFQQRLTENINLAHRYGGDTPALYADRAQIIERLNHLSLDAIGESFNALCGMQSGLNRMKWQQMREGGIRTAQAFGVQERDRAVQVTDAMMASFLAVLWGETDETAD
jgi:hypothetical protein